MTTGSQIAWDDSVLPFQLDASDIRGRVARLDGVLEGILKQHDYPPQVEALVAEMALLTALIGQTVKLRWKLQLQVQSKGAVRMIATDYYGPEKDGDVARIRAYASYDAARLTEAAPFDHRGENRSGAQLAVRRQRYVRVEIIVGRGCTRPQQRPPGAIEQVRHCLRPRTRQWRDPSHNARRRTGNPL